MIGIQLKGRLGNQMFQYAAARSLAEQIGCNLISAGFTLGRPFGLIGYCLGVDKEPIYRGKQQNGLLYQSFGLGPPFWRGRLVELALPSIKRAFFPRNFTPRRIRSDDGGRSFEVYDENFSRVQSGTWLDGWFQSEEYFASNSERVRDWFRPSKEVEMRLKEIMAEWPAPPQQMAAVHVRRGDYSLIRDSFSDAQNGWLLPLKFYQDALERLPVDAPLAIFSDDPDWAAQAFARRQPWVSRKNSAIVDMMLIAKCRYNIIANSSFSWWAAWFNTNRDKMILAPKYHLGWRAAQWAPGGIEVADWQYLEVRS